jgi:methyl-accepting chemotaxis protein
MRSLTARFGLLGKVIVPVALVFVAFVAGLLALVWKRSMDAAVAAQVENAKQTIQQYKSLRGYYTEKVVAKAKARGMKIDFVHEGKADTIPLPATMIHELSQRFGQDGKGISLQLYSDFPFPNRADRVLDPWQKGAIESLRRDPESVVVRQEGGATPRVRVAIADRMVDLACIQCHNTHPLSPKKDWRLGDMRGVLEVDAPLAEDLARSKATLASITFVSGIGLALSLWLLALALGRLVRPVRELSEITRRIVEEGDLTQQVRIASDDEVGVLARQFSQLVERLREIPLALGQSAQLLDGAVAALDRASTDQNAVVTRQATALQETQVTAEEIRQTSRVAARSAEGVLADIAKAEQAGQLGTAALEQSLQSMASILEGAKATARSISGLGERAQQIGGITGTVKDLADQSNMLALNAAIEAVRSGEHGKGFALVAREIRRLADQSIQSTERVREILEGVRGAVGDAVKGSESGARQAEANLEQLRNSAEHLRALARVVQESSAAVRQIATAVNQQDSGVAQVFAAVVDQNKMMEESIKQLEGTLKAVATLKEVSGGLAALLGRYKV